MLLLQLHLMYPVDIERGEFNVGLPLLVNMADKTSWLEQVLEASSGVDKNLLSEYRYRLFKSLESAQRTSDAELCVLSSKEDGISRDFRSEKYIPSSISTSGTSVAFK